MRTGVYVGSFDPVHKSHIDICNHLINNNIVDKIIIVPTMSYWEKQQKASLEDRINMLKFYESDKIIINTDLNNLSYTYEILDELKNRFNDDLYLILGADIIEKFYLWKNVDKILENKILVLPRKNYEVEKYIQNYNQKDNFIILNDYLSNGISSTIVREKIKNNDLKDMDLLLDKKVLNYILKKKLYK